MATNLDEQEAALYLSMMQLHEALGQMLDRKAHLQEKELVKLEDARTAAFNLQHAYNNSLSLGSRIPASLMMKEPKEAPKCASCGSTDHVEVSKWAEKGEPMEMLCYLCELEAEHSFYAAEATEVIKQEEKLLECDHCKEKKPLELSCYQPLGEMVALCKPCEKQAEVAWFSRSWAKVTEAMEGSDEGSI